MRLCNTVPIQCYHIFNEGIGTLLTAHSAVRSKVNLLLNAMVPKDNKSLFSGNISGSSSCQYHPVYDEFRLKSP